MPRLRPPEATPLGLNLAPMVDVVMCLIIFFMLASKLVERENSPIDLPVASMARQAEKRDLGRRVVINVVAELAAGTEKPHYVVGQQTLDLEEVARRLAAEQRRDPLVKCVIRGDRDLPYHAIETVLLACARAGISNVIFAAAREGAAAP